jgi:hypothetical protein
MWTVSGVKLLMKRPGKAAEFACVVPLPETIVDEAEWVIGEFQAMIARLLRNGRATAILLGGLLKRDWTEGGSAFAACSDAEFAKLATKIPRDLAQIGSFAFCRCSGLCEMTLPDSVERIGSGAFRDCSALQKVILGAGVQAIESCAFQRCSALQGVDVAPLGGWKISILGEYAFERCTSLYTCAANIIGVVKKIEPYTFWWCCKLQVVNIPMGVEEIGEWAFGNCTEMWRLTMPETVGCIGMGAFSGCRGLQSVEMPGNIGTIEALAFHDVMKIERLKVTGRGLSDAMVTLLNTLKRKTLEHPGMPLEELIQRGVATPPK